MVTEPTGTQGEGKSATAGATVDSDNGPPVDVEEDRPAPRRPSWLRSYGVALALFIVFVLSLVVAVKVYPDRAPIVRPEPVNVIPLEVSEPLDAADLTVKPVGDDEYSLEIDVFANAPSAPGGGVTARGSVDMPAGVTQKDVSCSVGCFRFSPGVAKYGQLPLVSFATTDFAPTKGGPGIVGAEALYMTVRTADFAWDENGLDAEMWIPEIDITQAPGTSVEPPYVLVKYEIPDYSGYDWNGVSPPLGDHWYLTLDQVASASALTGINNGASSSDSLRTFIAGIVLGIGGGALVGSIQELVHAKADGPRRHRFRRAARPTTH